MKKELLHTIEVVYAAVLLAAGVCAQEAPVAARNAAGRYQAMTGGETVYVIDTDTGAMLSKGSNGGWEIESNGFSNTVAAVRKRHDQQQKAREALSNLMTTTKETFPKLSIQDKIKTATSIFVVTHRLIEMVDRQKFPPGLYRPYWSVTEYLKKPASNPHGVPDVGESFFGFNVDPESGTKEDVTVVCFEVRGDGTNVFVCIPTVPVKSAKRDSDTIVVDASPTIVEDIKAILKKKE